MRSAGPPSLKRVLLHWLLWPLCLLIPLAAWIIYGLTLRPALMGLDRALTDMVVALTYIVEVKGDDQITLPLTEQTARALKADLVDETFFAVFDDTGQLLGGDAVLRATTVVLQINAWKYFDATVAGQPVRVVAHAIRCGHSHTCTMVVAETMGKRRAVENAVLLAALLGAAALALPMVLLVMLGIHRGMKPLQTAAKEVARRTPEVLEPIDLHSVPQEVVPFIHALNGLFDRLREAARAQRDFVADAAHQLRTPLAVLRVEATQALEMAHPAPLRPTLLRLHDAAERGARLVQQLLALARTRAAAMEKTDAMQRLDLSRLVREEAERWLAPSLAAGQDLGFDLSPVWVEGNPLLLTELLGNLIHNAIQHAGSGARITVYAGVRDGASELAVEDDGRGVSEEDLASIWQRFRRGRDAQGSGSGLGLSIVKDIAGLHGAEARLQAGEHGQGLCVRIRFLPPKNGSAA